MITSLHSCNAFPAKIFYKKIQPNGCRNKNYLAQIMLLSVVQVRTEFFLLIFFSGFVKDLTLFILKSHFWLVGGCGYKETQIGLNQFFTVGNNAHCLRFWPSTLISERSGIKGLKFCMLITPYTFSWRSNYSRITIDLLKKAQSIAISFCPKSIKTWALLEHFQVLACCFHHCMHKLSEPVTE